MTTILEVLDGFGPSPTTVTDRVKKWGDKEFDRFFEDYLTVCRDQRLIEVADRGSTDVFPDSVAGRLPLSVIRQLCVYANRIYIHDPVIELAEHFGTLDTHFERIMRTPNRAERLADFRSEFAETLEQLLELRPLIALGVVHVATLAVVATQA